jgi:hypothetical protein
MEPTKKELEKITAEGFVPTQEYFSTCPIYKKDSERIVYSPEQDRIVVRYDMNKQVK